MAASALAAMAESLPRMARTVVRRSRPRGWRRGGWNGGGGGRLWRRWRRNRRIHLWWIQTATVGRQWFCGGGGGFSGGGGGGYKGGGGGGSSNGLCSWEAVLAVLMSVPSWLVTQQSARDQTVGKRTWAKRTSNDHRNLRSGCSWQVRQGSQTSSKHKKKVMKRNWCDQRRPASHRPSSSKGPSSSRSPKEEVPRHLRQDEGSEEGQAQGSDYHLVRASYRHVYGVRQTEDLSDLRVLVGSYPTDRARRLAP